MFPNVRYTYKFYVIMGITIKQIHVISFIYKSIKTGTEKSISVLT